MEPYLPSFLRLSYKQQLRAYNVRFTNMGPCSIHTWDWNPGPDFISLSLFHLEELENCFSERGPSMTGQTVWTVLNLPLAAFAGLRLWWHCICRRYVSHITQISMLSTEQLGLYINTYIHHTSVLFQALMQNNRLHRPGYAWPSSVRRSPVAACSSESGLASLCTTECVAVLLTRWSVVHNSHTVHNLQCSTRTLQHRTQHPCKTKFIFIKTTTCYVLQDACSLQCFDAVGWVAGRASGL